MALQAVAIARKFSALSLGHFDPQGCGALHAIEGLETGMARAVALTGRGRAKGKRLPGTPYTAMRQKNIVKQWVT